MKQATQGTAHRYRLITAAFTLLLWIGCAAVMPVSAQNCNLFEYHGRFGLSDSTGREIAPPLYDRGSFLESKHIWIMVPKVADSGFLAYDIKTGQSKLYEQYYTDAVKINGEAFSQITEKGDNYLLSETRDKKYPIKSDYSFKNINTSYIIAQSFHSIRPSTHVEVTDFYMQNYAVFKNDAAFRQLFEGVFSSCMPLYVYDKNSMEIATEKPPVGFLFSKANVHYVYDQSFHLLGNFKMVLKEGANESNPDYDKEEALLKKCCALLRKNVVFQGPAYPMVANEGMIDIREPRETTAKEVERPAVPELLAEKISTGTLVSLKDSKGNTKKLFITTQAVSIGANKIVLDEDDDKKQVMFNADMHTGRLSLPEQYIHLLQLKMNP